MIELSIPDFDLYTIMESGQCFRMGRFGDGSYHIVAGGSYLKAEAPGGGKYRLHCSERDFQEHWSQYFDLDTDYRLYTAHVPESDAFLRDAIDYGSGMRIIRQDPWETLVSFIISQRKSIPAIRGAIEALCRNFGDSIHTPDGVFYGFPGPERIAGLSERQLSACSLGYRSKYVLDAAVRVSSGCLELWSPPESDQMLLEALKGVYGVGDKVASCTMLFGFHRLDAFPKDVWINRILQNEYGGVLPGQYSRYAGVLQQYMFYYARSAGYAARIGA